MVAPGEWRVSFSAAYGQFEAGHVAECPHVAPECATIAIPVHRHDVTLDLLHTQLQVDYGISDSLQVSIGLPFDWKDTTVEYSTLDGNDFDPPYGDIHHRNETLTGFSDAELMLRYQPLTGGTSGLWQLGAGVSVPFGETTEDPMRLGMLGIRHQHIQFGTGTVNPKLVMRWTRPAGRALLSANADARLSLTENDRGFRAATVLRWSAGPTFTVRGIGISPQYVGEYQTLGRWNGLIDEGTGYHNGGIRLQTSFSFGPDWVLAPSVYFELYSHSFHEETFSQGPTVGLMLSRTFRRVPE